MSQTPVRTLLFGPAGSGKTRRVLQAVARFAAPDAQGRFEPFLVVVPTYSQAEHLKRRLLRESPGGGLLDRGVVTFEQLAERRTGWRLGSLAPAAVRDSVLSAAFDEVADPAFGESARFAGLRRAALRFLDEVKALEPDPGADVVHAAALRIAGAAGAFPAQRAALVTGLVRVLGVYERRRAAAGLRDHGDLLRALLAKFRRDGAGRYRFFALDGFTDLTPVQAAIVEHLAAASDEAVATLPGEAEDRSGTPFAACEGFRRRLVAADFRPEAAGPSRRFAAQPLAQLERLLAGEEIAPFDPGEAVRFLAGADPDDEADRVARTVLRWTTEGIPRAEILVIVRSLASGTAGRIDAALRRHGVPARRMGGRPLGDDPCVRSALRIVHLAAANGEGADLVAALTNGDARGVSDRDADRLAGLVRERGARTEADVLSLADEAAAVTVIDWHLRLATARRGPAPRPPAQIARDLLAPVGDLLRLRFTEPVAAADEADVARDAAAMRALRDLAGDLVGALRAGGTPLVAPAEFATRLAAAAASARFSPPERRDDVVHLVDAEEARQWEARAVVVAGLRMGEFPAAAREDVFLTDEERAAIEQATGLALPGRIDSALRRESLLFYAAATRARERVAFTCPVSDDTGNPVLRSPFLDRALRLLPESARQLDGRGRTPGDVRPAPGETLHREDLDRTALAALTERFAAGQPSEIRPQTGYALLPHLLATDPATIRAAARWFAPPVATLADGGAARAAMARGRPRSASALADFAQCAYRHFAGRGLGLSEQAAAADDGIDALLTGQIAHVVLERAVKGDVRDRRGVAALVEEVFREMAGHLRRDLRAESVRAELLRVLPEYVATEWDAQGIAPGFSPEYVEWKFGPEENPVAAGSAPVSVPLAGAADRIDVDDDRRAIVVDYKWSRRERYAGIERKIEAGTDLQLPIYAIAAQRALGLRVVAAVYVTLRDDGRRWLRVSGDAPVVGKSRSAPPAGWGVGDGSSGLADAEARIVELDRRIRTGACEARPLDEDRCGAGRCPFADLCRYDGEPRRVEDTP